jgi:hypothetical protein
MLSSPPPHRNFFLKKRGLGDDRRRVQMKERCRTYGMASAVSGDSQLEE